MRKGIPNRTQMAGKLVGMVQILVIKTLRRNTIFVMKLMIILQQMVQKEQELFSISPARDLLKCHQKKGFKSSEENDVFFNVYYLEHHRAQANTVMGNAREVSFAKTYHMTNIQPKSMFWNV